MDTSKLLENLKSNQYNINLGGLEITISDSIVVMWMIMIVIIALAYVLTRNLKPIPEGKQIAAEYIVETINSFFKQTIGHHWKPFAPYLGTILIFLVFANTVSLFNIIPSGELLYSLTHFEIFKHFHFHVSPPTKDINITAALAVMSIFLVIGSGIIIKGPIAFLKSFFEPLWIMLPFKILDYFSRPLSLCMRLFGNVFAAYVLMELIYMIFPLIIPAIFSIYFDLFDGGLQAFIFVFLTSIYISETVE
ncbi:MAG: F0F1 ATP synthase subunit A [Clostridiales bacterium]